MNYSCIGTKRGPPSPVPQVSKPIKRVDDKGNNVLKGHSHAILVHFKNKKYVLTSMNAQN